MKRAIGTCGKCGGIVHLYRNGRNGVCEDCGAEEEKNLPKPNLPKLTMKNKKEEK